MLKVNKDCSVLESEVAAIVKGESAADEKGKIVYGISVVFKSGKGVDTTLATKQERDDCYLEMLSNLDG